MGSPQLAERGTEVHVAILDARYFWDDLHRLGQAYS